MQRRFLTSSIALAALALPAFAQSGDTPDTRSGQAAGASSFCAAEFSPAAADAPGAEAGGEERTTWEFAQLDLDGDGMISQSEYVECRNAGAGMDTAESDRSEDNMTQADADGSGSISRDEYMGAAETARRGAAGAGEASGEPVLVFRRFIFLPVDSSEADVRGMSQGEAARRAEQQFGSLDGDGNDELSRAEWTQRATTISDQSERIWASFGELDRDGDGALSEEEYGRALEQRDEQLGLQVQG